MREIIKSMASLSWAMSLFGAKQLQNMLARQDPTQPRGLAASAFDSITRTTEDQLTGPIKEVFKAGEKWQREMMNLLFGALSPGSNRAGSPVRQESSDGGVTPKSNQSPPYSAPASSPMERVESGMLDTTSFIVLGEGLAAGMGNFSLNREFQTNSFPAQIARQLQTRFSQPLIQAPGIGAVPGFACLPVWVPAVMQTTVLTEFPPSGPFANLSVPGFEIADAVNLRPMLPLVHRSDPKQTAANLILGLPGLIRGDDTPLPTQLEYACQQRPTFAIIELGYYDILEPAVLGDPDQLPDRATVRSQFEKLLTTLRGSECEVVVMTIPDPLDTAFFSSIDGAARVLNIQPSLIGRAYSLPPACWISVNGLLQISNEVITGQFRPLCDHDMLSAEAATQICDCVQALNADLLALADSCGAVVFDLQDFFKRLRLEGMAAGPRQLTADYLGGFYSLNGFYPGATGQALIANELLQLLNRTYGAAFPPIDLQSVQANDAVAQYQPPQGRDLAWEDLRSSPPAIRPGSSRPNSVTIPVVRGEELVSQGGLS